MFYLRPGLLHIVVIGALLASWARDAPANERRPPPYTQASKIYHQAVAVGDRGDNERALALAWEAMQQLGREIGNDKVPLSSDARAGMILNYMGILYERKKDYDKAQAFYLNAIANSNESKIILSTRVNLGTLFIKMKRIKEADRLLRQALTDPSVQALQTDRIEMLRDISYQFERNEAYQEAEWYYLELLKLKELGVMGISGALLNEHNRGLAATLFNIALMYRNAQRFSDAETYARRALVLEEQLATDKNSNLLETVGLLASIYARQGRLQDGEPLCLRAISMLAGNRRASADVIGQIFNHAILLYKNAERLELAERMYLQSIQMIEQRHGSSHPALVTPLSNLGDLYRTQKKNEQALPLAARALDIARAAGTASAILYQNLAYTHQHLHHDLEALRLYEEALARVRIEAPESMHHLLILINLAEFQQQRGDSKRAEQLFDSGLATLRQHPPNSTDTLSARLAIGRGYAELGRREQAEPLLVEAARGLAAQDGPVSPAARQAHRVLVQHLRAVGQIDRAAALQAKHLTILQRILGAQHDEVTQAQLVHAELLAEQGRFTAAEPLAQQALETLEKLPKMAPLRLAQALHALATVQRGMGLPSRARPLLERALSLTEQSRDAAAIEDAANDLGELYAQLDDLGRAQSLLERALDSKKKRHAPETVDHARVLNNLALVAMHHGRYDSAEPLLTKAVALGEKGFGAFSPELATWRDNLAAVYQEKGLFDKAGVLHEQALASYERSLGPFHPELIPTLELLARLRLRQGQHDAALTLIERRVALEEGVIDQLHSEARLKAWLARVEDNDAFATTLALLPNQPRARTMALELALLRKGRTLDLSARLQRLWLSPATARQGPDDMGRREIRERLDTVRQQIEALIWGSRRSFAEQMQLAELQAQAEKLETQLYPDTPRDEALARPQELVQKVAAALPRDGVLVELVTGLNLSAETQPAEQNRHSYVALLLFPSGKVEAVPLGARSEINRAVAEFLTVLRDPNRNPLSAGQTLHRLIMAPLVEHLAGKRLYISPEDALHLVPWVALHDGTRYLLDVYPAITYLTSGRDLLRRAGTAAQSAPLIIGAPRFLIDRPVESPAQSGPGPRVVLDSLYAQMASARPLPNAADEGKQIARLLPGSRLLLDEQANEEALRQAVAPQLLHIATHGVFLDAPPAAEAAARSLVPLVIRPETATRVARSENPLSRSALLLAGAASAHSGQDSRRDGIFTAQEATTLPLVGTQLVVLSACDTGSGSIEGRQGVYGLRRAFFIAGTETLVVSLWQVADQQTSTLMTKYYRHLLAGRGRSQAMSEASRELARSHPHPYYWAPFVVMGNDSAMRWKQ